MESLELSPACSGEVNPIANQSLLILSSCIRHSPSNGTFARWKPARISFQRNSGNLAVGRGGRDDDRLRMVVQKPQRSIGGNEGFPCSMTTFYRSHFMIPDAFEDLHLLFPWSMAEHFAYPEPRGREGTGLRLSKHPPPEHQKMPPTSYPRLLSAAKSSAWISGCFDKIRMRTGEAPGTL